MKICLKLIRTIFRKRININLRKNKKIILLILILYYIFDYYDEIYTAINDNIDLNMFVEKAYKSQNERYIMYRCDQKLDRDFCGGIGDRLKGILSTYLWSLLTNRTIVVKITRPCNIINLMEPNLVDWDKQIGEVTWLRTGELHKMYQSYNTNFLYSHTF